MNADEIPFLIFIVAWCSFCLGSIVLTIRNARIADRERRAKEEQAEAKRAKKAPTAPSGASGGSNDPPNRYWATGTYDPDRYYRAVREYGHQHLNYIRDNYGDLDTYESNRPD